MSDDTQKYIDQVKQGWTQLQSGMSEQASKLLGGGGQDHVGNAFSSGSTTVEGGAQGAGNATRDAGKGAADTAKGTTDEASDKTKSATGSSDGGGVDFLGLEK